MLPRISSVIDYRRRHNVLRKEVALMLWPHIDVICELLLNRLTTTWKLFVVCDKEAQSF